MSDHNSDCCSHRGQTSSFVFGLLLGLLAGAVIAVLIYRYDKNDVIATLKKKIESFIKKLNTPPAAPAPGRTVRPARPEGKPDRSRNQTKPSSSPSNVIASVSHPKPRMFVKAKNN